MNPLEKEQNHQVIQDFIHLNIYDVITHYALHFYTHNIDPYILLLA